MTLDAPALAKATIEALEKELRDARDKSDARELRSLQRIEALEAMLFVEQQENKNIVNALKLKGARALVEENKALRDDLRALMGAVRGEGPDPFVLLVVLKNRHYFDVDERARRRVHRTQLNDRIAELKARVKP